MENCLITKLKGTINNDNFPELNTLYLNLVAPDKRNAYGVVANNKPFLYIFLNGGSVRVESQIDFFTSSSSSTALRSITISDTNYHRLYFNTVANLPAAEIKKCVKITGDIYQIRHFYQGGYGSVFDFMKSENNGLKSMEYAVNLKAYGGYFDKEYFSKNVYINPTINILIFNNAPNNYNIDKLLLSNISYISSSNVNNVNTATITVKPSVTLNENTAANTNFKGFGTRCNGNVMNLPINTMCITEVSSTFSGNFSDYYQRISEERPEGKMAIAANSTTSNTVIVEENTLYYYIQQNNYVTYASRKFVVITWDSNGIITVDKDAWDDDIKNAVVMSLYADNM